MKEAAAKYAVPQLTVPAGCVYVLGDNRNVSDDSHLWGPLPVENVVGKAFYILWPVKRQGFVDEVMLDLEVTGDPSVFFDRIGENLPKGKNLPKAPVRGVVR